MTARACDRQAFIYALLLEDSDRVVYVGASMNPRARGFFYAPLVMDALDRPWDKKVVRIILEEITADKSVECETYWIELLRMCQHPLRNKRLPSPIWHEKRQKYADSVKARSRILHADELNTDASGE